MILELYYRLRHPGKPVPYFYKRSILGEIWHLLRKAICQNIAPNCVTNFLRIRLYRLCGIKIGGGTFIGMKCYLDDLCYDRMEMGSNVIISYGVYFACHGPNQGHNRLVIKDGAYIGMRASIIVPHDMEIGENAIVGAMALVNKSIHSGKTAVGVPCKILEK
jgi:Serine acetyltransferase